jgi:hypothetical protein
MALTTPSRVRALAGFQPKRVINDPVGVSDGSNLVFAPSTLSFILSPTAAVLSPTDVTMDDGSGTALSIASVTENIVVLSSPPTYDSSVTMSYWGSNISNTEVLTFIAEVDAQIIGMFIGRYSIADLETSPLIGKISSYLAAAAMTDEAYETAGLQTSKMFPSDRLRAVANDLLGQILNGAITLLDTANTPLVEEIESWMATSNYANKDRVFENDPFNVDSFGNLIVERVATPFEWEV